MGYDWEQNDRPRGDVGDEVVLVDVTALLVSAGSCFQKISTPFLEAIHESHELYFRRITAQSSSPQDGPGSLLPSTRLDIAGNCLWWFRERLVDLFADLYYDMWDWGREGSDLRRWGRSRGWQAYERKENWMQGQILLAGYPHTQTQVKPPAHKPNQLMSKVLLTLLRMFLFSAEN